MIRGLNRHYYSIAISYRKNELEQRILMNLHKKKWSKGLILRDFEDQSNNNAETVEVGLSPTQHGGLFVLTTVLPHCCCCCCC